MDDEDSKARRNFMAISTIIVLAWWLEAPLDKISEKLLGMPSAGPQFEMRVWTAAAVAPLYFALRLRFSKGHAEGVAELVKEREAVEKRLLMRWVKWEALWYVKRRFAPVLQSALSAFLHTREPVASDQQMRLAEIDVRGLALSRKGKDGPQWFQGHRTNLAAK